MYNSTNKNQTPGVGADIYGVLKDPFIMSEISAPLHTENFCVKSDPSAILILKNLIFGNFERQFFL